MPHSMMGRRIPLSRFEINDSMESFETSTKSFVKLCMGPYEANGIIRHRTQRIKGLLDSLSKSSYSVEFVPTVHLNRLSIEFYGREIFRCNIKNLQFNLPAEDDPICRKALEVLKEHEARFCEDQNIPQFVSVNQGMRFLEMNKFLATADRLCESDIELLFEIKTPGEYGTRLNVTRDDSLPSVDSSVMSQTSIPFVLTPDVQPTATIEDPVKRKPQKMFFKEVIAEKNGTHETKTEIQANEFNIKKPTITSVRMDIDDEPVGFPNVFERAIKNVRMRRASYMFKSGEIRSVDALRTSNTSTTMFDLDTKPEVKNQKLISKVLNYRNELMNKTKSVMQE